MPKYFSKTLFWSCDCSCKLTQLSCVIDEEISTVTCCLITKKDHGKFYFTLCVSFFSVYTPIIIMYGPVSIAQLVGQCIIICRGRDPNP